MGTSERVIDEIRREVAENCVDRGLECDLFYLLTNGFFFPIQNVGTEAVNIGTPNARVFAWAENDKVEIEIIVKRKGR